MQGGMTLVPGLPACRVNPTNLQRYRQGVQASAVPFSNPT